MISLEVYYRRWFYLEKKQLLIIGAGPYGLATAAYAKYRGLDFLLLGKLMGFWKHHMPKGMFLRTSAS
jgi:cation diffusion facilitator CzcD-associated flavoprotein CzcO